MTDSRIRICIIIPFYNNRQTVNEVATRCAAYIPDIFLIDDGSTDGSGQTIDRQEKMRLIEMTVNSGKGAAVQAGAQAAFAEGFTHAIQIDADLQHDPDSIPLFLQLLAKDPGAVVIGVRRFDRDTPILSRFGRWFGNLWVRIETLGIRVDDTQCGFRLYPLDLFNMLRFDQNRMAFDVEIIVKAVRHGFHIRNLEVPVRYFKGNERVTHFRLFRDNWEMSKLHFQFTWGCLVHWPAMLIPRYNVHFRRPVSRQQFPIDSGSASS